MKVRFLPTVEAVAATVREERAEQSLTEAQLAAEAGVDREFVADVEAGRPRHELAKVLAVLEALDIHAAALPSVPNLTRREDVDLQEVIRRRRA